MIFKRLNIGSANFTSDAIEDLKTCLIESYDEVNYSSMKQSKFLKAPQINKALKLRETITALALCHNVTPVNGEDGSIEYQASSPDEVALVKFTESIGLTLCARTFSSISIRNHIGDVSVCNFYYYFIIILLKFL